MKTLISDILFAFALFTAFTWPVLWLVVENWS